MATKGREVPEHAPLEGIEEWILSHAGNSSEPRRFGPVFLDRFGGELDDPLPEAPPASRRIMQEFDELREQDAQHYGQA